MKIETGSKNQRSSMNPKNIITVAHSQQPIKDKNDEKLGKDSKDSDFWQERNKDFYQDLHN